MCLHLWLWKCKTCWSKLKEAWIKLSSAICDLNNVISSSWCSCSGQLTIKYAEESGRHSNWIQFLFEAENSWRSDQNVGFERKRRNMYIVVLSEKSGKREITIVVLSATKGCLCLCLLLFRQEDPRRPGCQNVDGRKSFFLELHSLFWDGVLHASCLLRPTFTQFPDPGSINGLVTRPHQSHQGWHQFSPQKNEETRIVFTLNNFKVALEVPNENCMHFRFIIISVSSYFLILFDVVLVFPPQ